MSFLDSNNFTIKSNNTELYALSGTCNGYSFLYGKYLEFLALWHIYFYKCSSTNFLIYGK